MSPAATILPVIVASFLAGVTATFLTRETAGVRDGIRAGIVSALIGSASLVVLAVLHGDSLPGLLSVELLAILSFPPSVAVALIGAIAVTFVRHPPELSPRPRVTTQSAASRGNLLFRVILGAALLGYLTPLFFLFQPAAPKVVLSEAPSATPPPAIPSPTPVPWSYEKPTDFASLPGRSIGLVDQKQIQDIDGNLPMTISPDGSKLAFFTTKGLQATLQVLDLSTLKLTASFAFSRAFSEMSWSPDSTRIFFLPGEDANLAGVIDVAARRVIELPIPNNRHLPAATPRWWHPQEIAFPEASLILDLDTLQLITPNESKNFSALSEENQKQWFASATSWKSPSKWTLDFIKRVETYDIVPVEGLIGSFQYDVAISDNDIAFSRAIPAAEIWEGDRLLAAADGSKFIRMRENTATVFYLGKAESPMMFTAKLPLENGLEAKSLFVCAPVTNPLNDKVVGADREHVKAIARVVGQKDGITICWIDQEFEPVTAGDIVGDSHQWEGGAVKATSDGRSSSPWAPIEIANASPPERAKTPILGNICTAAFHAPNGTAQVSDLYSKNQVSEETVAQSDATAGGIDSNTGNAIQKFIRNHHKKSSASDVAAVTNDYANHVEYFDNGIVTQDFIAKDVAAYHNGHTLDEKVLDDLSIQPIENNVYAVSYQASVMRRNIATGDWRRVIAAVELEIAWTQDGFKITKQHAKILSKDQSP